MAGSTILDVVYALDAKTADDGRLKKVEEGAHTGAKVASSGAYLGKPNGSTVICYNGSYCLVTTVDHMPICELPTRCYLAELVRILTGLY